MDEIRVGEIGEEKMAKKKASFSAELENWDTDKITSLESFLITGESFHSFNGCSVVKDFDGDYQLIQSDGRVFFSENGSSNPAALVLQVNSKRVLINNGDEEGNSLFINGIINNGCTLSFNCLAELLKSTRNKAFDALANGTIKLIDFTPDETRELSASDKKLRKAKKEVTPPERGFTVVNGKWHRSSTVLLSYKKESWLIGQDEGTYFGVVLCDNPKTVKEAFISLIPEHIRNIKGVLRQGEWFAIPVKEKDVPKESECFIDLDYGALMLPLETDDSNRHTFEDFGNNYRISSKGFFAKGFVLSHDQHADLKGKGWYTFVKNTALRSVSVEGVD